MKISTILYLIIFIVILISGVSNIFLIRFQSVSLHENSEILFSKTVTQSLSETLIRDVIDGNKIRVSNELNKFVSRENPIDFLFIVDSNHKVFAHSFKSGFPKYLLDQKNYDIEINDIRLINRYHSDKGFLNEYASPLLKGVEFVVHIGINQSHFTNTLSHNNRLIFSASMVLLFLSMLFAYFGSRLIINPLRRFTSFVERYGSGKQLKFETLNNAPAEVENLTVIFKQAIEKRYEAENELAHQANFDPLTQLPNRHLSEDRLLQLLHEARRKQHYVAVMFIDLDDFKKVNDSLGHEIGDKILVLVSSRLQSCIRDEDTIGRLGGDEFIGLFGNLKSMNDAQYIAENLLSQFLESFKVNENIFNISASIGVAFFPDDGENVSELLRKADTAMYHSKTNGRNIYSFHSADMFNAIKRKLELEENMFDALENNELQVYYQPKLSTDSNQIVGFEALLRWNNSLLGSVSPEEFIPVAEQNGLIIPIGKYVIDTAVNFVARLNREKLLDLSIAVNLSPSQFRDSEITSYIKESLSKNNLLPDLFEIEITENVLLEEHSSVYQVLDDLNNLNIKISMDDFGTGYSSLSYLRRFPFDSIKIDRSFITDIAHSNNDRELVNATIIMAHALELTVVAEGVETEEQLEFLKNKHCDIVQGYYFSKPLPEEQLLEYINLDN